MMPLTPQAKSQALRDCLRALRLYASPVFLRQNPMVALGTIYGVLCLSSAVLSRHGEYWRHGYYTLPPLLAALWWVLLFSGFSAITTHYWRQMRALPSFLMPRMGRAEYRAVHLAALFAVTLFSIPPLLTGAPWLNTLLLEAIALVLWSEPLPSERATSFKRLLKPRTALSMLGFFILLVPKMQAYLFSAPASVALLLIALCCGVTLLAFRHRTPEWPPGASEHTPSSPLARLVKQHSSGSLLPRGIKALTRLCLWRPSWLVRLPLIDPINTERPIAFALSVATLTLVFVVLGQGIALVSDGVRPSFAAVVSRLPIMARQSLMLSGMGLIGWMRNRSDWPFLLTLGPYGSKQGFARAVLRLHLQRGLQAGLIVGPLLGLTVWLNQDISLLSAFAGGLGCGVTLLGASCLPSLAFFIPALNKPSVVMIIGLFAMIGLLQISIMVLFDPTLWWRWLIPAGSLAGSFLLAYLVPLFLARQDWPIEPPP